MALIQAGLRFAPRIGNFIKTIGPWAGEAAALGTAGAVIGGSISRAAAEVSKGAGSPLFDPKDMIKGEDPYDLNESYASQSKADIGDWWRHVTTGVSNDDITKARQDKALKEFNNLLDSQGRRNMNAGYRTLGIEPPSYLDLEWNDGDSTAQIKANQDEAKTLLEIYQNLPSDISIADVEGKRLHEVKRILAGSKFSPESEKTRSIDRQNAADAERLRQQRYQEWETTENRKQRAHEAEQANKLALGKLALEEGRMKFDYEDRRLDREDRRRQNQRDSIAELIAGLTQLGAGMAL